MSSPPPSALPRRRWLLAAGAVATGLLALGGRSGGASPAATAARPVQPDAPLFEGLDGYTHAVESSDPLVRRYMTQGMLLAHGFNPGEARRSFEAAVAREPNLARGWWALAWVLGPNLNTDMQPGDAAVVDHALQQARLHAQHRNLGGASAPTPPVLRDLIEALSRRHPAPDALDEEAYAERMATLVDRYPDDADVAWLAAESLINLHPYDWWDEQGAPLPSTPRIEAWLQQAIRLAPAHPGAHHYRIHLHELSRQPQRAQDSADRLRDAHPGAPHLLHMPSHIDLRTGRYADAITANLRAIEADRRYLAQVDAQSAYRLGYVAHNHHFLWAAACMAGQETLALDAALAAWPAACGPTGRDPGTPLSAHYAALPMLTRVRFGRWQAVLEDSAPPDAPGPYTLGLWHYARGVAQARRGNLQQAEQERQRLRRWALDPALQTQRLKNLNPLTTVLQIADHSLQADLHTARGATAAAVRALRAATALEDRLLYDEPHPWLGPTRHALGAALLADGQAAAAAVVYREDLVHYPANGWSLSGLARALAATGDAPAARLARTQAEQAFAQAERQPPGSRF